MPSAEACDTTKSLILDFYRHVRLAHEALPNQIDVMPDMVGASHHGDFLLIDFIAFDSRVM